MNYYKIIIIKITEHFIDPLFFSKAQFCGPDPNQFQPQCTEPPHPNSSGLLLCLMLDMVVLPSFLSLLGPGLTPKSSDACAVCSCVKGGVCVCVRVWAHLFFMRHCLTKDWYIMQMNEQRNKMVTKDKEQVREKQKKLATKKKLTLASIEQQ